MPTYGRFEILEELHRTALGSVSSARITGDVVGARYVVKVFDPALMGLLESDAATQSFLDRAGLQKHLAERGAQNWAPVHELKPTAEGAFYVTDYYPLTAQKLINGKVQLNAKGLHHLISGLVAGLLDLKVARNRAHGNLKPANILIAGKGDLEDAGIFLADPASDGGGTRERTADLEAVGQLIHQLVLQRPFRGASAWPVPESAEWSKLGAQGDRWRELCNWVLNPNPPAERPVDLDGLAVALREFARGRRLPMPGRRPAVLIAVLVAILVGGTLLFSRLNADARQQLDQANAAWFANFSSSLRDPARRQNFRTDADLIPVVNELERAEAEGVSFQPGDGSVISHYSPLTYRGLRRALASVRSIEQQLRPESWKRLGEAAELQKQVAGRRWDQPARFLTDLTQNARPGAGGDVARGIDRFLQVQPRIAQDAAALDPLWQQFDADLHSVEKVDDRAVASFAESLRRSAIASIQFTDAGVEGAAGLQAALPPAARLAQVVHAGWPASYARQRLADDIESQLNMAAPGPDDLKKWLDNVDGYALATLPPNARPIVELAQAYKKLLADVAKQTELSAEERATFERARAEVEQRINALGTTRFVKKDVPEFQGDVAVLWKTSQRDLDLLRKQYVKYEDPKDWFVSVDQGLAAIRSERIQQRWKAYTEALRRRLDDLALDRDLYAGIKKATDEVKGALVRLDEKFPPVPTELKEISQDLVNAAWERREQQLFELTAWSDPKLGLTTQPAIPGKETVEAAAMAFGVWCTKVRELAREFPIRREVLVSTYRPDEVWRLRDPAFWNDPAVQNLVRTDLKRIKDIQDVNSIPRDEVIRVAADSPETEIVLAAWRRLGTPGEGLGKVSPPWPTKPGELEAERGLRFKLAGLVKALKDAELRTTLEQEIKAQGPERWRRFANAADNEQKLSVAIGMRSEFQIGPADLAILEPAARFNLTLFGARSAVATGGDPALKAAVAELTDAAKPLSGRRDVNELQAKLARVFNTEPMTGQKFVGDRFVLPIGATASSLEFVRISPKGLRPFYLSTTEVSLGAFIDLIDAYGAWAIANELLGNIPPPGAPAPAPRYGPQAWRASTAPSGRIERWATWHYGPDERQAFTFDASLGVRFNRNALGEAFGGNPVDEDPMQQVPAQAAVYAAKLINCRLPTVREWQIAAQLERQRVGNDVWNLRDEVFRVQRDYQPAAGASQWPDAKLSGVFFPQTAAAPTPTRLAIRSDGRPLSDGTLFFRPVSPPPPAAGALPATWGANCVFQNIVGNVAEFTCDAPDAFDGLPLKPKESAAEITQFLQSAGSKVSVIGGSALSAPELPLDTPYPPNSPAEPYADVGFRLAFSVPAKSVAERLRWALDEQPYLVAAPEARTRAKETGG